MSSRTVGRWRVLAAACAMAAPVASCAQESTRGLGRVYGLSDRAVREQDAQASSSWAARAFDGPSAELPFISPPPVPLPEAGSRRSGNLLVGEPGHRHFFEPGNPLSSDGTVKPQKSGNAPWWGLGGAAAGAAVGFLLGGLLGAGVGALLGGALGYFFGP